MPSSKKTRLTVGGLAVDLVRKDIKNLHLGVYPPHGRVRIAVPLHLDDEAARLAVVNKLPWLRRQIAAFEQQPRMSESEAVSGESWYVFGRRFRLLTVETTGRPKVLQPNKSRLELHVPVEFDQVQRLAVLDRWYRGMMREAMLPVVEMWEKKIGVVASSCGVKRMKTKWGSCNDKTRSIWLNSELAKKPIECLEYIVVHELIHLKEPSHNENFVKLMDKHLPNWRNIRDLLNSRPLAHEDWLY
jgi:predicted metal-dependent hydrolase